MAELSENALQVARKRYFWKTEKSWNDLSERVCRECAKREDNFKEVNEKFLSIVEPMDFIPAGRILRNLGKPKPSTSNCNVLPIADSIEAIGETLKNYLIISSFGGGTGINFSSLRPAGAELKTKGGVSSGVISFINIFNESGKCIETGGQRRSAAIALLDISHPEIIDFINAKTKHNLLTQFNISVIINSRFLRAVELDEEWPLVFSGKVYKVIKAKELWYMILNNMLEHAEPGLINWDNFIKNNTYYCNPVVCCNPCGEQDLEEFGVCLAGDTLIYTPNGIRKLDRFNEHSIFSFNFTKSTEGFHNIDQIVYKGQKNVCEVTLRTGYKLKCTPTHRIYTKEGWKPASELTSNDFVQVQMKSPIRPFQLTETVYEVIGWMHGDGWFTKNSIGISFNKKDGDFCLKDKYLDIYHSLFGQRKPLRNDEISYQEQTETKQSYNNLKKYGFILSKAESRELPEKFYKWTLDQQLSFIRGYFNADGGILGKSNKQVGVWSRSEKMISQVQQFLSTLGINSRKYTSVFKCDSKRKPQHKLILTKESARKYMQLIGFSHVKKAKRFDYDMYNVHKDNQFIQVKDVITLGVEDVYDVDVPETKCFFANGVLVHNCNLGSLTLPHFVTNTNTNWQKLSRTIDIAVRFLDNIIDLAYYPISEQESIVKGVRRIGLGTMGLADYLFMKKIRYGSEKSIAEIEKLYKFIRDEAYKASIRLAQERGAFPKYNKIDYNSASFVRKLPPKIRMAIKEYTIRNSTILSMAPTGTISLLADVVSGIEPLPFKGYKRSDRVGERLYIHKLSKTAFGEDWFVDSYDLKPEDHLEVQVAIQKFVDSSVSKTLLLPESATTEDLDKYLMEYIQDLKGVTVYRDNSRDKQVYYRLSKEEMKKALEKQTTNSLSEEDVKCARGTCDI